jgi:phosphate transport system substrate-binding protein
MHCRTDAGRIWPSINEDTWMLKRLTAVACAALALSAAGMATAGQITGAGSTFAAPIYGKWSQDYSAKGGDQLNYQSIGSGGGIKQIEAKTVDFGATDMALSPADLDKNDLAQFPTVTGGVVPVMNLPGIKPGQVKLTGPILAGIYLGEIKKWNDPQIAAINRGVPLPNLPITVVHRSDGSGTTFIFASYLSLESGTWKSKVGAGTAVSWPTGLGGKGNEGVAAFTKQTLGAIGYVEYAYALQNHMTYALMRNKNGSFVPPTAAAFKAASAGVNWSDISKNGFNIILLDEPGAQSWPISGATFVLIRKHGDPARSKAVLAFFNWAFTNGDGDAESLDYVPLPPKAKALIRQSWASIH